MEIRYSGTYTADELMRLDAAVRKAFGMQRRWTNLGCYGVAALIMIPLCVAALVRGDQAAAAQWFILGGAALVLALWSFFAMRRAIQKSPFLGRTVSGVLRDDGFEMHTDTSHSTNAWAGIQSLFVTPDYLLAIGPARETFGFSASFFPSRTEFESACALARAHVSGTPPGKSWGRLLWTAVLWIVVIIFVFLLWSLFQTTKVP